MHEEQWLSSPWSAPTPAIHPTPSIAYSAKTDDRPDFQRMIKDSGKKKIFDVVLVWKLDRFARNRYDAVNYKYQLEKNGVHLVSAMEPISQGPEGIMVESMLIGMAEYYSAELAPESGAR